MKFVLRKFFIGAIVLITLFNLLGCSYDQFDEEKIGENMEGVLSRLFEIVQIRDQERFKSFFADHVVELSDFEEGCNYVFEQYQGGELSVKCDYPMGKGKHIVPGEEISYAFTTFDVSTDENNYTLYVQFYTNSDNQYKIRKFKLLSKQQLDSGENFNDCTQRYGVYYPGWLGDETN